MAERNRALGCPQCAQLELNSVLRPETRDTAAMVWIAAEGRFDKSRQDIGQSDVSDDLLIRH